MSDMIANRIEQLREQMRSQQIDYYFIPARDEHNDEYTPPCWKRRSYISGFTGSAGDVIIGLDQAYLWTDPRYFLQAEQELDSSIFTLMKQQQGMAAPIHEWLRTVSQNKTIATDPKLLSLQEQLLWQQALDSVDGYLIATENNLIDSIWSDQPEIPCESVIILDEKQTGESVQHKIQRLRQSLKDKQCNGHVVTMLDSVAWLYNIRGTDINFNPLVIAYAFVTEENAFLFIDERKMDDALRQHCEKAGITLQPYDALSEVLQSFSGRCLIEGSTASWWVAGQLQRAELCIETSPITFMKSIKNNTEIAGMREAHRRDGLALCKTFYWLEHHFADNSELSAAHQVDAFRAEDPNYRGQSFATISGYANHGAIIHYFVTEETDQPLGDDSLYLMDSGVQYCDGTTDVTRTTHFGTPNATHKRHYTLVLKGHLALRHLVFPSGTCGEQINMIAGQALWKEGLTYGHGTGHGVGCYLCVHEGPQRISGAYTRVPLEAGMIVSNEPGVYITGQHGIRIENLVLITEKIAAKDSLTDDRPFLGFEDLTVFPYERKLIDTDLLSHEEVKWINDYHQMVFELLQGDLDDEHRNWLRDKTLPITKNK